MIYIPHNSLALLIQFSDIFVYSQNCVSITTSVEFFEFCFFIKFFFFFCQAACEILCPLNWKHRALTAEPPGKLQYFSSLLILLQSTTNFKQHKLIWSSWRSEVWNQLIGLKLRCCWVLSPWLRGKVPIFKAEDIADAGWICGSRRYPGGGYHDPLQDSCLENLHEQRSLAGYSPWGRRVGHDWSDLACTRCCWSWFFWRLSGESVPCLFQLLKPACSPSLSLWCLLP